MSSLHYQNDKLHIENVNLETIAERFGTPCYVYSRAALEKNWQDFATAFKNIPHRICYAVKANSNLAILNLFARFNSGFDIVSHGELERVITAGGDPKKIIFSGVGKNEFEIEQALKKGIYCFNVESKAEFERLQAIASKLNTVIQIALRINPNIDPHTHTYISTGLKENKFGIEINEVIPLVRKLKKMSGLKLIGIACHIGSQIIKLNPFQLAIGRLLEIYKELHAMKIKIQHINFGGGLGIAYHDEHPPTIQEYAKIIHEKMHHHYPVEVIIEPGRALVANAGVLLMKIEYLKYTSQKNFAIVDAGMNDLLRPALYHAWQNILPVSLRNDEKKIYDVAGPVCESADFLGKDRVLAIEAGDLLAVDSAGAYGFSMSSNYNSRGRPAEILVDKDIAHVIRRRETIKELFALEKIV